VARGPSPGRCHTGTGSAADVELSEVGQAAAGCVPVKQGLIMQEVSQAPVSALRQRGEALAAPSGGLATPSGGLATPSGGLAAPSVSVSASSAAGFGNISASTTCRGRDGLRVTRPRADARV